MEGEGGSTWEGVEAAMGWQQPPIPDDSPPPALLPSIVVPSHHLTSPTPTPSTHKYLIHSLPQIVAQQSHTV